VGKSKQLDLLEERFAKLKVTTKRVEYPVYHLKPTGPILKKILWGQDRRREEEEMQRLFVENRKDFEPTLRSWLGAGMTVLAEDYKGTGMVWGVTRGLTVAKMEELNRDFIEPDISILVDGPRRLDLRPGEGHIYQQDEDEWYRARKVYLQMADKYGWVRVGGDAPILTVAERIWAVIRPVLAERGR
jgi:thymidylate kinase